MSTRTIIEINHDRLGDYEQHPEYWAHLIAKLSGGGIWDDREERLWPTPGIRQLASRHHTTKISLEIE